MSNIAFNESTFERVGTAAYDDAGVMTVQGSVTKSLMLGGLTFAAAIVTWNMALGGHPATQPVMFGGLIAGLIVGLITTFKPNWAPVTAPLYGVAEGLFLGAISAMFNHFYDGIVLQALCLTFGTMFTMLIAYQSRVIRATDKFRKGLLAATGAVFLVYAVSLIMRLFGAQMPFLHEAGPIGIGISVVILVIAALNLILDFDLIEQGAAHRAPKYMEWYAAFGLLVTVIWLYIEFLRLLAKLQED